MSTLSHIPRDANGNIPKWIFKRLKFVEEYCKERGWDMADLSIDQVLEVRKQQGWIDAHPPIKSNT